MRSIAGPAAPQYISSTRLLTVKQWTETHAWPPLGGLRHLIFFSKSNGFDAVIRRVGRRVLIDETAFFDWVRQSNIDQSGVSPRTCASARSER
jgi:hypothetical protein